jgi:hypothetical protein
MRDRLFEDNTRSKVNKLTNKFILWVIPEQDIGGFYISMKNFILMQKNDGLS